jgi:PIN domain nuclease of toxin-antitoxin system
MAHKHVVDAHTLVWCVEGNPALGNQARLILADPNSQLVLPMIALAEAICVVEKQRCGIPSAPILLNRVQTEPRIDLYPLTWDVLQHSLGLTALPDLHDRLTVATALHLQNQGHTVDLLTKDATITRSGLVPTVW